MMGITRIIIDVVAPGSSQHVPVKDASSIYIIFFMNVFLIL